MPLVQINHGLILHTDQIRSASRCGNYTHVVEADGRLHQIWDEDMTLWTAIMGCSTPHPSSQPQGDLGK